MNQIKAGSFDRQNPELGSLNRWLHHPLTWFMLGFYLAILFWISDRFMGIPSDGFLILYGQSCAWLWAAVLKPILDLDRRLSLRGRWFWTIHLLMAPAFALIHLLAMSLVYFGLQRMSGTEMDLMQSIRVCGTYFFVVDAVFYALVVTLGRVARAQRDMQRQLLQQLELQHELVKLQLSALKSQLRPHFFFNTLNGIAACIRANRHEEALEMLVCLSDLMRQVLKLDHKQCHPLQDELALTQSYVALESKRCPRLSVNMDVAPELLRLCVPVMMLQPIVENAIRHGIEGNCEAEHILITIRIKDEKILVDVYNDGVGLDRHWRQAQGVGLRNLMRRFDTLAPGEYLLNLVEESAGVRFRLSWPQSLRLDRVVS